MPKSDSFRNTTPDGKILDFNPLALKQVMKGRRCYRSRMREINKALLAKNQNLKQRQTNQTSRDREYLETDEIIALIEAAGSRGRFNQSDQCLGWV